ncbi:helix-turn-helix domain-containing protein [Kutzneria sp. NPDC052558]|uniref:helix-turn-helix domain-containing protein n=1 Tax=Kutzneria sp. NPDC052558 TaxID=3364121 RepID=UPI0037C5855C
MLADSIHKALVLHRLLQGAGAPVRLQTLSDWADLPKSTTHRLLSTLVRAGLVTRFGVGYTTSVVADRSAVAEAARDHAPFVCDVAATTGFTASLAHLEGAAVAFTHRVFAHNSVHTPSDDGETVPAIHSAAGLCLLAQDMRSACELVASFCLPDEAAELNRTLMRIAGQGYAVHATDAVWCMAVPLPPAAGVPPLALTVKRRPGPFDEGKLLRYLRHVAQAIGARLEPAS